MEERKGPVLFGIPGMAADMKVGDVMHKENASFGISFCGSGGAGAHLAGPDRPGQFEIVASHFDRTLRIRQRELTLCNPNQGDVGHPANRQAPQLRLPPQCGGRPAHVGLQPVPVPGAGPQHPRTLPQRRHAGLHRPKVVEETLYSPAAMAAAGAIVGAVVLSVLNTVAAFIPQSMAVVASQVLGPASSLMMNPVMPVIFWLAALDAGHITGVWSTILGGLAHMIMGNAVPGIVLGILIGKSAEEHGYSKSTNTMIAIVAVLFILIAYFRGFHTKLIALF
ncbi:MAG: SFCGS family glycine-rich protein [Symbiobacterium sp.]|uniref:SFCGS family glycine-rich protein n=1 Tax=Symbiobacterium sp. TaxID=1971213 RepID=UPI003464B6FF